MTSCCRGIGIALALAGALLGAACVGPARETAVPEEVLRQNVLGTAYLGQQKWTEAEQAFRAALALRGDDPLLLNNLAVALIQQGRIDEAQTYLDQALVADPAHPWAHYNLGLIEKNRGDFERATTHFEAVAAHDPDDLLTQYNLGVVYSRTGRDEEAERAFRAALAINPSHVSSLYGLGRFLLQGGEQEEGARLIALSQEIRTRSGLDEAVGSQYGEQGPYAMGVDYPGDTLRAPAAIPVSFERAASATTPGGEAPPRVVLTRLGADAQPAVIVADAARWVRLAPGGAEPLGIAVPEGTRWLALAAGDADNDGLVDLAGLGVGPEGRAALLLLRQGADGWAVSPGAFGAVDPGGDAAVSADLRFADFDHDGDIDLFWCWVAAEGGGACRLATNDGSGTFAPLDAERPDLPLDRAAPPVHVALSDVDNDRDIDLLASSGPVVHVLNNQRDGSFLDQPVDVGADVRSFSVADVDKNGFMDLVVASAGGTRVLANRDGRFARGADLGDAPAEAALVLDYDNDGFLDVAHGGAGALRLSRNTGAGEWVDVTGALDALGDALPVAALDVDGDGDLDCVTTTATEVALWTNEGGNANGWIAIDSRGVGDNDFGVGSKVELLAGGLRQKFEVTDPLPLHGGLGSHKVVESVRTLWPSGVLQDEIDRPAGGTTEITQLDRKGTSCPLLYAWRDGAWRFVTDFLGGSAIGYQHAPGSYGTPDTDEYVLLPGLDPDADGLLRVRMNNQLEEVLWFDRAELLVVDHPQGTEVYPNERLMPAPPFPPFRLFVSDRVRPVAAARSVDDGSDLTELLREEDRRYAGPTALLPFKGYARPHTIELDLGPADGDPVLLLDGWIDYADSSSNIAAAQAGVTLVPPRLFVADGRGGWRETEHVMGFPAGLPKTMAVDLRGLFPSSDRHVRIETSMRIYWDRARVLVGDAPGLAHVQRLDADSAVLRFGGFPARTSPDGVAPFAYDPARPLADGGFKAHVGRYTAFGDVRDLLAHTDDRFVTTRNGDEVELRFRAPEPPPAGMRRTYLFFADGFGKDMDPNSAAGSVVGPVPFHGMPTYPYADDVSPPPLAGETGAPGRIVLPSPSGWPGALPQPLVASGD